MKLLLLWLAREDIITVSLQKQVAQFTKVISHVWEIISKGREDWEGESMRSAGKLFCINKGTMKRYVLYI